MTLLVNRFDYQPIPRKEINGKRKYSTPDGNQVASVTTILDATSDKTHLDIWRRRVGHQNAAQITTEAANRGTRMHKYLEKYVETGIMPDPGTNPYAKQSHMMATVIQNNALSKVDEVWGSEVNLFMPQIYAGTTDMIGLYQGAPAIMDFKQSNKLKKKEWVDNYHMQIVAYALAHNEIYGTDINQGHIFICVQDGTYQQFDIFPEDFPMWKDRWWTRVYDYYANHV